MFYFSRSCDYFLTSLLFTSSGYRADLSIITKTDEPTDSLYEAMENSLNTALDDGLVGDVPSKPKSAEVQRKSKQIGTLYLLK